MYQLQSGEIKDLIIFLLKNSRYEVKAESEKAGLKFSIQKMKIMASSPIISWQIDGKQWK